jgi:hypothetical protein
MEHKDKSIQPYALALGYISQNSWAQEEKGARGAGAEAPGLPAAR